jgi:SAM-dependent methyltransferase
VMAQTTDSVEILGPDVGQLRDLIRQGNHETALLLLLVTPNRITRRLLFLAESAPGRFRATMRSVADGALRSQQAAHKDLFLRPPEQGTAVEMFDFFYGHNLHDNASSQHYRCRFAQPRHLAALTLSCLLPSSARPILDLACGFGHHLHYWRACYPRHTLIGADRNFFHLYVAKNWVAPGAGYICSEADTRLPFRSGDFCGVCCTDAFHYFLRKQLAVDEMRRIIEPAGLLVLNRIGNRQLEPREGYELSPEGYQRLFAGLHIQMFSERELLQRYLKGLGPDWESSGSIDLSSHKWLHLVASADPARFRDRVAFTEWPHCAGRLRLNPLYQKTAEDSSGCVTVQLKFPTAWYEFENSECLEYMPRTAQLTKKDLQDVEQGVVTDELRELLRQCVIVGMPDRYGE